MHAVTRAPSPPEAVVVGAGVSGLTVAVALLEAGFSVAVVAREVGVETKASGVAAALWEPYAVEPKDLVARWAALTYRKLAELATVPGTGVSFIPLREVSRRPLPDPFWLLPEQRLRRLDPSELLPGYADGFEVEVPLAEALIYLPWLEGHVAALGGSIERREIADLAEVLAPGRVVVHCTGVGARQLVGDERVMPARGQVVWVAAPGVATCYIDDDLEHPTYVFPRPATGDCVLGGTFEAGRWDLEPDPATTADILARCRAVAPALADAEPLDVRVGLRPYRDAVRLEAEEVHEPRCLVIHDYGHGGAGFTLSWGCAADVVALALAFAAGTRAATARS